MTERLPTKFIKLQLNLGAGNLIHPVYPGLGNKSLLQTFSREVIKKSLSSELIKLYRYNKYEIDFPVFAAFNS